MKPDQVNALLLDLLSEGADIQTIIDQSALMIGQPLVIVDTRFHILHMSTTVDPPIQLWQEAKATRYISDNILTGLQVNCKPQQLFLSDIPIQDELPNGYHAARYALHYQDSYRGFVGMYDYLRPFTDNDMLLLQSVGKAVNAMLPRNADLNAVDENAYESLIYQLLRCPTMEQAAKIYRKHPQLTLSNQLILLSLFPDKKANYTLPQLKELLHQTLHRHISVIMNDHLFLLLEADRMSPDMYKNTLDSIEALAKKDNIPVGVSVPFSSPAYFPNALRQTEICIERLKNNKGRGISLFEDNLLYCIAQLCLSQHSATFFLHPILRRIKEYDATYHVSYLDTLKVFIANSGNLKATASALGVHYNTIKYRMAVIENITGISLHDQGELLAALHISLLIDDLREKSL